MSQWFGTLRCFGAPTSTIAHFTDAECAIYTYTIGTATGLLRVMDPPSIDFRVDAKLQYLCEIVIQCNAPFMGFICAVTRMDVTP